MGVPKQACKAVMTVGDAQGFGVPEPACQVRLKGCVLLAWWCGDHLPRLHGRCAGPQGSLSIRAAFGII